MNKTLIILTLLLNSCMTGKQIAKTGVEKIQFGTGGGFTGVETMYTLNQDGDIKDKSDSVLHNMSKKDVLELFEKASKNKDIEFQKPENHKELDVKAIKVFQGRIMAINCCCFICSC